MTSCHSTIHPLAWSSATFAPCHHSFWAHKPLLRNLSSKAKSDPFQISSCWYLHLAFWIFLLYTNSSLSICQSSSQNGSAFGSIEHISPSSWGCPLHWLNSTHQVPGSCCLAAGAWHIKLFIKFREPPNPRGLGGVPHPPLAGILPNGKWRQWQFVHLWVSISCWRLMPCPRFLPVFSLPDHETIVVRNHKKSPCGKKQ